MKRNTAYARCADAIVAGGLIDRYLCLASMIRCGGEDVRELERRRARRAARLFWLGWW